MSLNLVVLIRKDPTITHQPVEGLRIALGLSTGPNPLTIILLGPSLLLLSEELHHEIKDLDTLEKYIPTIQDLGLPIIVPNESQQHYDLDQDFTIQEKSKEEISDLVQEAHRVLVF